MGIWFESCILDVAAWLVFLTTGLYVYLQWVWCYWKKQGVTQLQTKFPFGNFTDAFLMRKQMGFVFKDIYDALKEGKFAGTYMFTRPGIMFKDLELVKACLVKDFNHFHDRGLYDDSHREPLSAHLLVLRGQKWKNLRVKITPAFTSGKIKMMFFTVADVGAELGKCLEKSASNGEVIEIKDYCARYTTDIIFSCAFGVQCNSLMDPDTEYRQWGKKIVKPGFKGSLSVVFSALFPFLLEYIPLTMIDHKVSKYFRQMVRDTMNYREENNVTRKDFLHLLMQLKNKGMVEADLENDEESTFTLQDSNYKLSVNDLAAQAFFFFIAGFETSSTTMTFCLYELALHSEIQERLQKEIDSVLLKHNGQVTYEAIAEMEYLEKVVSETLRKYPPVPILNREVTVPYNIPGTNVILKKGTPVVVPVLAIHRDPRYYPNPEKFDPERFSEQEKAKRPNYTYMPFGEGPRTCIGMRFAYVQTKVGLVSILSRYNVGVCEKTPIPLELDRTFFILSPSAGMWLKITKRKTLQNNL